jgi:hypothetical protein
LLHHDVFRGDDGLGLALLHGVPEGSNAATEASTQLGQTVAPRKEQQDND